MISLFSIDHCAAIVYAGLPEGRLASLLLDYAEPIGWQDFGEFGKVELFNLRKDIPGHPRGSTVSRQTLEAAIRVLHPQANYGAAAVEKMDLPVMPEK